ncbi:MAG: radical SAM protein [Kiritimatiellae bacterium]|nr:radical SAM protein [Kiritimatiellia bacterium]
MKVCFDTFGCRLNKAEALQMEADYIADGWQTTESHSNADLIVVRGCSVTARAQQECEQHIAALRSRYPSVPVRVCGCLAQTNHLGGHIHAPRHDPERKTVPMRTARAYLKAQDGCAGKCTFCIVPSFRGESKSENFTALLDRAKRFIDAGYRELVVTGCNLALYASEGKRLPDLVAALAELSGGNDPCRVRIGSLEPGACALDTVRAMAEHRNVCRFLHIPVQSASKTILDAMNRPYTPDAVAELTDLAVSLMPGLGLGCDLMTGFPGESEVDFAMTKNFLQIHPFSNAHIFPYSERPGTTAAAMMPSVHKAVRSFRAHLLADVIQRMRRDFAESFLGKTVEIVVEDEEHCTGWTGEYLRCSAHGGKIPRRSIARVIVNKFSDDCLHGRLVQNNGRG